MAITINGSGTITGVSAGGLPDGSITADDLASTLDISGKTVTLPSDVGGITQGLTKWQSFSMSQVTDATGDGTYNFGADVGTWSSQDYSTDAGSNFITYPSVSNGRFAFTETGTYLITFTVSCRIDNNRGQTWRIRHSTDGGSTFNSITGGAIEVSSASGLDNAFVLQRPYKVTNTTNQKIMFNFTTGGTGAHETNTTGTNVMFLKLE